MEIWVSPLMNEKRWNYYAHFEEYRFLEKFPLPIALFLCPFIFADCNHLCRSTGSITSSAQVTNEYDCSFRYKVPNWNCIPTTTTKL